MNLTKARGGCTGPGGGGVPGLGGCTGGCTWSTGGGQCTWSRQTLVQMTGPNAKPYMYLVPGHLYLARGGVPILAGGG